MTLDSRTWLFIAMIYISYIVYGTLLPFNFSLSQEILLNNLGNIEWLERYGRLIYSTKNVDTIINFLFYMPLGVIVYNLFNSKYKRKRPILSYIFGTICAFLLSLTVEFLQLFTIERATSIADIVMNTSGGLAGTLSSHYMPYLFSQRNRERIRLFFKSIPNIIILLPFLFSGLFLPEHISLKYMETEKIAEITFYWQYIIQPVWVWYALYVFIPIGLLVSDTVNRTWSTWIDLKKYSAIFFISLAISVIFFLLKASIYRISFSPEPLIYGLSGIVIGIVCYDVLKIRKRQDHSRKQKREILILWIVFSYICFLILYKFAYPFQFNLDRQILIRKFLFSFFSVYSFIPFYQFEKLLILTLQSFLMFMPVGMIIGEMRNYLVAPYRNIIPILLCSLIISVVFLLQMVNQYHTSFLYDLPISLFGLITGYTVWQGFRNNK